MAAFATVAAAQAPGNGDSRGFGELSEPELLPVHDTRPKDGTVATEPIAFDFEQEQLLSVIKSLGALTGRNFNVDPNIASDTVTVVMHQRLSPELAYHVLESILASRGYEMVETLDGNLIHIVRQGERSQEKRPLLLPDQTPPSGYDKIVTVVEPVRYQNASDLQNLLTQARVGSLQGQIDAFENTNTLIITDNLDGIRNILRMLAVLDTPGNAPVVEIFTLEYTRAETLAQQLNDVLVGPDAGAAGDPRAAIQAQPVARRPPAAVQRPGVPGQTEGEVIGQRQEVLRIVHDERLNALITVATEGNMERVRHMINMLDQPTPYEADNMHVYELLNARAENVAEAVNQMIGGVRPRDDQAGGATGEIQPFEKTVQVTSYEQTNALLVVASPEDYRKIQAIIALLDVPRRQVHVEAIIMDVAINDDWRLSVEAAALSENDFFALSNVARIAQTIAQGPLALTGAGGTIGFLDGTTEVNLPDGSVAEVANVPLLLDMLETITDTDILSQPSQTMLDNEPSSIIVGQEVPFVTGTSTSLSQAADVNRSVFSQIQREEVGIKLDVTPQISEGDYVNLDLVVEVSQTIASDIGADVNTLGPTLQLSKVQTVVSIRDGSTGIIGGLISEGTDRRVSQTPVLGDLPLLGWLFRSKNTGRQKRNLVVMVSPYIVKDSTDLTRFTQDRIRRFRQANVDVLYEKGFIRKVRQRHDQRNNYRPSVEHSDSVIGGQTGRGFNRGDL